MALIILVLAISAIYSGGMYLFIAYTAIRAQGMADEKAVELITFHLGLCLILSVGFLGLLLK